MTTLQPCSVPSIKTPNRQQLSPPQQPIAGTRKQNFRLPTLPQAAAILAGLTFTAASAATNLTYAIAKTAVPHEQAIWGAVAVAASVVLALSPSGFIKSARNREIGAAITCLIAALIFGTFSVVAALGSATGGRMVASLDAGDATTARAQAVTSIETKSKELAALAPTRTLQEIDADVARLEGSRRDLNDCYGWLPDIKARAVCVDIQAAKAEGGRAQRRSEIEGEIAKARATIAAQPAKSTVANTDALALQGFASALGWTVTTDTLNRLLVLVSVLAIELGGGLAFAVAGSLGRASTATAADKACQPETQRTDDQTPLDAGGLDGGKGVNARPTILTVADDLGGRLLALVETQGGSVLGSTRKFGSALGASHTAVATALEGLEAAGRIVVESGKHGTVVRLVA